MNLWNNAFTPMLLKEVSKPFNDKNYLYELKFDGIRAIVKVNKKCIKIVNRHNKDITHLFPELASIKDIVKNNCIFDGEIVAMEEGYPSFLKLQHRIHLKDKPKIKYQSIHNPIVFIAFDILYKDKNLDQLPLIERKKVLDSFKENDSFLKSRWIEEKGISLYKYVKKVKLEGIVAKKKDSVYEINKRSLSWLKIKNFKKDTFLIGGYQKNKNNSLSLLLGKYINKEFIFVGKVMLSPKRALYERVLKQKKINKSPFKEEIEAIYIKPTLSCLVSYSEMTQSGHLRQPHME